jgi:hypothetical protein
MSKKAGLMVHLERSEINLLLTVLHGLQDVILDSFNDNREMEEIQNTIELLKHRIIINDRDNDSTYIAFFTREEWETILHNVAMLGYMGCDKVNDYCDFLDTQVCQEGNRA